MDKQTCIFVQFRKGKREYSATVSSWSYKDKNLWLYIWGDKGNCGYIPNAKVISTCVAVSGWPHLGVGVDKIIQVW